jgi:hypothetical protein
VTGSESVMAWVRRADAIVDAVLLSMQERALTLNPTKLNKGLDWIRLVRWFFDDEQAALFPKRMAGRIQA